MKKFLAAFLLTSVLFTSCDTLNKLPTNTTGGIFSLNGSWVLTTASDSMLLGTVINIYPGVDNATITSVTNNNSCLRINDVKWKGIKSSSNGFTLMNLTNACVSPQLYTGAEILVLAADQIRLTGKNAVGADITQTWTRSKNGGQ
ncbi:hypothetical protein BH09BAC2_BH09BAC2_22200 [soil metagenome]